MSDEPRPDDESADSLLNRRQAIGAGLAGAGALSLPAFLAPGDAIGATPAQREEAMALFLGQKELPVPPKNAKVHTSACQYCNVGCGYKIYTWPVKNTPNGTSPPAGPLGDWVSPTFVTRGSVDGKDSYIAVVPDKDCVVNKGDHSPRGGTNALTVFTKRKHPLSDPTERNLYPQMRDKRGGPLRRVSWDEALNRVADAIKAQLDAGGPSSIGLWGADHLSPEMNFATTKLFFAPSPRGLYNPALGPDAGVAVRAIHNRPKWNSEHPSIEANFGSANTLLYSYKDFELADTVLMSGANSYVTGTVFYNRIFSKKHKQVVIDPRRTISAKNAMDTGGVHLQLRPNTDVVLVNTLMNVILATGKQDQAYIDARVDPASYQQLVATVTQDKYRPENTQRVTGVPPKLVRQAAALLGVPRKTSILFEKGVIWSGTQNEAVMNSYANLALLLGSVGRPGQVFGRQGGHQSAYMYDFDWPHPAKGDDRRNLWQELQKGTIGLLIFAVANPLRMQQQATQLTQFAEKVPFIVDVNMRPQDTTKIADVVLPAAAWGEYTYTRENLERRLRVNQKFYDAPGQVLPEYLIFTRIGQRLGQRHGLVDPNEYAFSTWEDVFNAMRQTKEGKAVGIDQITPAELAALGTNGIQEPITRQGNTLFGTERMYSDKFATDDGRARFVAHDQQWTDADPLAFLPEAVKPNKRYPFFVTTIRYQTVWQSGYTFRYLRDLSAHSQPYMELVINPKDARKAGLKDGDWAEVRNQFSRTEGVVNVSDEVPPGLISAIFGWQGYTDKDEFGMPQYYANNLVAGGPEGQQKSNGAFFKNARAALRKLNRAPITARTAPSYSLKSREGHAIAAPGSAGNPASKAKEFVTVTLPPGV
jgi:arsenite oxidase large subunit